MPEKPKKYATPFGILRVYDNGRSFIKYPTKPVAQRMRLKKKYRR